LCVKYGVMKFHYVNYALEIYLHTHTHVMKGFRFDLRFGIKDLGFGENGI